MRSTGQERGFSLIEIILVVAIIAILAAIGIPRMTRGNKSAAYTSLKGSLRTLRDAIDLFAADHEGTYPSETNIENQLTQYSDEAGTTNATKTTTFIYGPYLRSIPPLPVGSRKGNTKIATADANDVGWIYDKTHGTIRANTQDSEVDDTGKRLNQY